MARRKKSKKTHHRRRMSGIKMGGVGQAAMDILAVAVGMLGGRYVNATLIPTMSPTLVGFAEAGVGALGLMKAKKMPIKLLLAGFGANGAAYALGAKGLAVLPASIGYGPDSAVQYNPAGMSGYRNVPKIGFPKPGNIGFPKPPVVGGMNRDNQRMARMYAGVYN